jgi:hypothetical protein
MTPNVVERVAIVAIWQAMHDSSMEVFYVDLRLRVMGLAKPLELELQFHFG